MCTGEVERKVWMRLRSAGLIASAQRSMSLKAARDRPQITACLVRLAISWTAAKSPSEAIGKPASMMSTPIVSSSSATSSFSSCVMVAPGHCSPSRKVVSKMTTRSFSDWLGVVMASGPFSVGAGRSCPRLPGALGLLLGSLLRRPLSAQAQAPSRPSGGAKEQEPAKKRRNQGQRRKRPSRPSGSSRGHRGDLTLRLL